MLGKTGYCGFTICEKDFWINTPAIAAEILNHFEDGCEIVVVAVQFRPQTSLESVLSDAVKIAETIISWFAIFLGNNPFVADSKTVRQGNYYAAKITFVKESGF